MTLKLGRILDYPALNVRNQIIFVIKKLNHQ